MNDPRQDQASATVVLTSELRAGARVARIEVSEPRRLNVLDSLALDQLCGCIEELAREGIHSGLRAVVLCGGGERAFLGGADLRELAQLDEDGARAFITRLHDVCRGLRELPVPVIAAIRGYCLGAGLEIAASCDMRVATTDAVFGMPEVLVGIPSVIEAALLPLLVGWGRAREMMLTGRTYDAREALAIGLVEEVVAAASLDEAIDRRLGWIRRASPRALAAQKELFSVWERGSLADGIAAGIDSLAAAYRDPDPRRRMVAFLEGRAAARAASAAASGTSPAERQDGGS